MKCVTISSFLLLLLLLQIIIFQPVNNAKAEWPGPYNDVHSDRKVLNGTDV